MSSKPAAPEVPGIDLSFRPASYFWPMGLETHLLATVKGAERKEMLKSLIDTGQLDELPEYLTRSALTEAERQSFGRIHPMCMGGEYLPDLAPTEVEILRHTMRSTTRDVISVYARRGKSRIYYRVVDEYNGEVLSEKRTRTSNRPLTLGELEIFFNNAFSLFDNLEMNYGEQGYDIDDILNFVIGVDSEFYPDLDALYRERITAWAAQRRTECGFEEETHNESASEDVPPPDKPVTPASQAPVTPASQAMLDMMSLMPPAKRRSD